MSQNEKGVMLNVDGVLVEGIMSRRNTSALWTIRARVEVDGQMTPWREDHDNSFRTEEDATQGIIELATHLIRH